MNNTVRVAPPYTPPPPDALTIIAQTPHFAVIDKPAGLLSVPGRGPEKAVCAQSITAQRIGGDALVVHRLDMDTSGLMVFARTQLAQKALSRAFQARSVEKSYIAMISGVPTSDSGEVDLPIAKYSRQRPLRHIAPDGQYALTRWQVERRWEDKTLVTLHPVTGRSHQLRLHMKALGHPILGDPFYGDPASAPRLLLHAESLGFPDPETGEMRSFEMLAAFRPPRP